jgi:hypothetical protein
MRVCLLTSGSGEIKTRKGTTLFSDDHLRPETTMGLRTEPAFSKDGFVTAGNASE